MARQARPSYSNDSLTTPPPIVGMEVSARWKRTWKGEVIMTIIMPNDVVDTEVYVKTSRGHTGIQMDPWMSCTWRRNWSSTHPPNTQTKEKMRKYKLQKAGRRISLFRTAGKPRQMRNSHWSPRPEGRCHVHPYSERRTPSPHKKKQSVQGPQPNPSAQTLLKQRGREEIGLMTLLQTVPLKPLTMNNQTWQVKFTQLPCPLNPHLSMRKD